jgi:protein arginine kinase activator
MKCDKCKTKEACYHSTLVINGEVKSTHLCEDCAKKEGVFNKSRSSIFDDFKTLTNFLGFDDFEDKVCPNCNWTLSQFKRNGVLGCDKCYSVFEDEIDDIVKRIQPYTENKLDNIEFKVEDQKKVLNKEQKLINLKAELQKAINEERYEDAGVINKEIKKLTKELKGE